MVTERNTTLKPFTVPHRKSANQWKELLEADGYSVSIVCRDSQLRVFAFYWPTHQIKFAANYQSNFTCDIVKASRLEAQDEIPDTMHRRCHDMSEAYDCEND